MGSRSSPFTPRRSSLLLTATSGSSPSTQYQRSPPLHPAHGGFRRGAHCHRVRPPRQLRLLVHDDPWRHLWIWHWLRDGAANQGDLSSHPQHFRNSKGSSSDSSRHPLVPRGEALALVVFQCSGPGRFPHVCKGAAVRDGHSAPDRVQGGGKRRNGTPPKGLIGGAQRFER